MFGSNSPFAPQLSVVLAISYHATAMPSTAVRVCLAVGDALDMAIGKLLASVSPVHAVTAGSAITMTGLAIVGLFFKPGGRVMRTVSWVSLGMVTMYVLNTYGLFLHGE